jgi:hypothetical protein
VVVHFLGIGFRPAQELVRDGGCRGGDRVDAGRDPGEEADALEEPLEVLIERLDALPAERA